MIKRQSCLAVAIIVSSAVLFGLTTGCVSKERAVITEVTKTGKDWVENDTEQRYTGKDGKVIIEKQKVFEKVQCVGPKGKKIQASSNRECIKKGGKVIDKVVIEEESITTR